MHPETNSIPGSSPGVRMLSFYFPALLEFKRFRPGLNVTFYIHRIELGSKTVSKTFKEVDFDGS